MIMKTEILKTLLSGISEGDWKHTSYIPKQWLRAGYEMEFHDVNAGNKQLVHNVRESDAKLIAMAPALARMVIAMESVMKSAKCVCDEYNEPDNGRSLRWSVEELRDKLKEYENAMQGV